VGRTYNVWLDNAQIITDFKGTRSPEGYIGLQNHGNPVTFRKVLIDASGMGNAVGLRAGTRNPDAGAASEPKPFALRRPWADRRIR